MNRVSLNINIDFELLRRQKEVIQRYARLPGGRPGDAAHLEGVLCLFDHIQDKAVDSGEYTEEEVFGGEVEV